MTGLLLKDIYILRRAAKTYLYFIAFYLILTLAGVFDSTMVTGFIALFTMMLSISSFSYDELARWDRYAAALPVGRRGIVGAKYLLVLCLGVLAQLLITGSGLILWLVKDADLSEIMVTGLVCVAVGLVINSILLPLLFKFGAEKGRLIMVALFAVTFLLGFGGAKLLGGESGVALPFWLETYMAPILAAVVALALFFSLQISRSIYEKKEL